MDSKSFLLSKTIWSNVIGFAAAYLGAHNLPVDADTQATLVAGILAAVNIGLRFLTVKPIHVVAPPSPAVIVALLALGFGSALVACTPQELEQADATAVADFKAGCNDWNSVKGIAGEAGGFLPSPLNQVAAITEGFVGDACENESFIAGVSQQEVSWINQSTKNLQDVVAKAQSTAPAPAASK
jgi:hypothetical protein